MYIAFLYAGTGAALCAALIGLTLAQGKSRRTLNLLFTGFSLSGAAYLYFTAEWHTENVFDRASQTIQHQTGAAILACGFFVWFIAVFSRQKRFPKWLLMHSLLAAALLSVNYLGSDYGVRYSVIEKAAETILPWGERIGYFKGAISRWAPLLHGYFIFTFAWGIWCGIRIYRIYPKNIALLHASYLILLFVGVISGVLVDRGAINTGYWAGPAFIWMVMVVCIGVALDQVRSTQSLRKRKQKLEKEVNRRIAAEQRIKHIAFYDDITGLLNRNGFIEYYPNHVAPLSNTADKIVLFVISVGTINNIYHDYGADFGNSALREISEQITGWGDKHALKARIRENQFAIVQGLSNERYERLVRLSKSGQWPYEMDKLNVFASLGKTNPITVRVGAVLIKPELISIYQALDRAQYAVEEAEDRKGSSLFLYTEEFHAEVEYRKRLEVDLKYAASENQLYLRFQPKIHASGGFLSGEALLRWRHPVFGDIPPDIFIPIAEQSLQIDHIGDWVLRAVCKQLSKWQKDGVPFSGSMAVNVSGRQLQSDHIITQIESLLDEYSLSPSKLEIEVTESLFIGDKYGAIARLEALRGKGITVAIDDFGTGYSSLSRLHSMPLDTLKIDKSLVDTIGNSKNDRGDDLVHGIISIGKSLGMNIVAEGVETSNQLKKLVLMGCDQYQGYLFSRPLSASDFAEYAKSLSQDVLQDITT